MEAANVQPLTAEEIEQRRKENIKRVCNFVGVKQSVVQTTSVNNSASTNNGQTAARSCSLKEFDTQIINILNASDGPQSPKQIHAILENNGVTGYTTKNVCDKCWNLEKKGLIAKAGTGQYSKL